MFVTHKKTVDEKRCSPVHYAYLYDRVAIRENRLQLFGTQYTIVNGKCEPFPIEDEAPLDERRKSLGLCKLAEYITYCEALRENKSKI